MVREFLSERRSGWARRVRLDAQPPDVPNPYAAFGWLPPGESLDGGTLAPTNVYLTAGPGPSWALTVYSPSFCNLTSVQVLRQLGRHMHPQIVCSDSDSGSVYPVTTVAAARVDGHAAFWTAKHVYLIWQYAHGAWASLEPSRSAAARTAIKVASEVSYGAVGSPVKYPADRLCHSSASSP